MRILLDECVPARLGRELIGHEVRTVPEMGWASKENGALLIVLWNALILHARWAGIVKHRGMAVLCIIGNMITAWSWFGTNQLGVGLHAYGFNKELADGVRVFWISQMMLIALGLVPVKWWLSSRALGTR